MIKIVTTVIKNIMTIAKEVFKYTKVNIYKVKLKCRIKCDYHVLDSGRSVDKRSLKLDK